MTCRIEGCERERIGNYAICSRHRYLRDHHGSVDATPPKGRSQEDVMAFARRLGEEMRARKMGEMPVGSLGWMLAGDAAWRAATEGNETNACSLGGTPVFATMGERKEARETACNVPPASPTPENAGASNDPR